MKVAPPPPGPIFSQPDGEDESLAVGAMELHPEKKITMKRNCAVRFTSVNAGLILFVNV